MDPVLSRGIPLSSMSLLRALYVVSFSLVAHIDASRFQEARGFVCSGANVVYMLIPADIWVDGGSQVFG